MARHHSAGRAPRSKAAAAIGLRYTLAVIAAASLGFAQAPARSANSCNVVSTNSPASTSSRSLVDAAPYILPLFNNAPVFGLPGTIEGGVRHRTQLIGDPDCKRTDLVRRGIFIDLYSTSAYQNVTSGGLKTGDSFVQNTQLSINLDTDRAGLWPGGLIHFAVQSRYGSSPESTFTGGSIAPEYTGLELPGPDFWHDTLPSEYSLMQAVGKKFNVILGKINGLFLSDKTLFGDRFRYYFANSNFFLNPIYNDFFNTMTLAAIGVWTPTQALTIAGGVHDPHTEPNNVATNAFHKGQVNLYVQGSLTYMTGGLPAQIVPAFNWSNEPKIDLDSPFGQLLPGQNPQAVDVLLGGDSTAGLPINFKKRSFFVISNFSQYLYVKEEAPSVIAEKLGTGQPLRGVGVFGRFGYAAPEALSKVNRDASVALVARGLLGSRQYDSFGMGYYYNGVSSKLKDSIQLLTDATTTVKNESGIEAFYDFAITPAINVNAGYQHIWNPLFAKVYVNKDHADLFLVRLNVVW